MEKDTILYVINGYISKMPSLPVTVSKILQVCNDPNTSPTDLNQIISLDPVLMGRVMRLINSAYYSLPNKITSLVRAIIMLGINTVKNLALSTAVLANLGKGDESQAINMDGFWRHSLCVGVTAKAIARMRKVSHQAIEGYFVAGILHDIGKIPLNNRLSKVYVDIVGATDLNHAPLYQTEQEMMGINHSDVGKLIIQSWSLGKDIEDVVLYHHKINEYDGEHKDIVYSIIAANWFANNYEIGFSGDHYPDKIEDEVFSYLGINYSFFDDLEEKVIADIEKASIFLKVSE